MSFLRRFWKKWRHFGQWMGDHVARVVLVAFYFTFALPFGLLVRYTQDTFDRKAAAGAGWVERPKPANTLADAEKPY